MVDIIRRKNVNLQSPDVSSGTKATANAVRTIGSGIGSAMQKYGARLEREQEKADKEYTAEVQQNLKEAQTRLVSEQKAFDASDKIVAADMAGRLENDLLRWNLEQRAKNPSYIGTAEHEKRMRDEYARLSNMYGQGLGEAGREEFTKKTQSTVNDFIGNDVKWAYQQKIKQGEESAKQIAETMNKTAGMYGANGDVDGFKESHKESRDKLKEYIENTAPAGASPALYELDKKSLVDFMTNMAQTDPVKAKAIMDSMENFKEVVPDDMLQGVNDIVSESVNRGLNEKRILLNAGIENSKKGTPQRRELEKQKKQLEKDIKKAQEQDYSEQSLGQIHKEVSDAVKPVLEKSLGESALIAKKEHEEEKVARFGEFLKLPTPENLKFFEEDNQMSYAKPEENMSKLPDDFFSYGDQSTLKDYYDIYKGKYDSNVGLTDMINNIGMAEDDAQIQFFDKIDGYKKQGMSEEKAIEKVFDDNPNNKFGDVSTLKDFYDMFKGRYDEESDATILSKANTNDLKRIDNLVSKGMSEEDAVAKVFNESEQKIAEKTKANRAKELLDNMLKYRENFGNVSMVEISDYKGTKQMFDDLKTLAQTDSDRDGNMDNVLMKSLVALNNAKQQSISQSDYNNYERLVNKILFDASAKQQINQFIESTKNYMPDDFWDSPRLTGSERTRINEQMESRMRDVFRGVIDAWANSDISGEELTKMYLAGVEKAYNDTVSDYLGIDMNAVVQRYKEKGISPVTIHGVDYLYDGVDPSGNPIFKEMNVSTGYAAVKKAESQGKLNTGSLF